SSTLVFPLLHISAISIGAAFMTIYGYSFIDTLFEATSAAGCVGLSAGVITYSSPLPVKLVIIVLMLLGRVEYVQLFLLMGYLGGKKLLKVIR
ncbi:MAG: TrkH family potassium uptake protein, partial [Thermoprotei archaeon]